MRRARIRCRIAVIRRQLKRLAMIAAERAAQVQRIRATPSFRPPIESETEAIADGELLASFTDVLRS